MDAKPPNGVGLGGDGDEIEAITEVERVFGVKLDYTDAPSWHTAGDVFAALRKALPAEEAGSPDLWSRFAAALTDVTGVDPTSIEPESLLLSEPIWGRIATANGVVWVFMAIAAVIGVVAAVL